MYRVREGEGETGQIVASVKLKLIDCADYIWIQIQRSICYNIKKMFIVFLLLCFTLGANCANIKEILSAPVPNGDLNFLRALNNFYGCKTWGDVACLECSAGYFFNDKRICSQVSIYCKNFNRAVGVCEQCYLGYAIFSGQCVPI